MYFSDPSGSFGLEILLNEGPTQGDPLTTQAPALTTQATALTSEKFGIRASEPKVAKAKTVNVESSTQEEVAVPDGTGRSVEMQGCGPWNDDLQVSETGMMAEIKNHQDCSLERKSKQQAGLSYPMCIGSGNPKEGVYRHSTQQGLTYPVYKNGTLLFLSDEENQSDAAIRRCFAHCFAHYMMAVSSYGPTVTLDGEQISWRKKHEKPRYGHSISKVQAEDLCGTAQENWKRHLLVNDRWIGGASLYHFLIDNVFPTWVTRQMIALQHKLSTKDVDVAILIDFFQLPQAFEDIWTIFFGPVQYISTLTGCYRTATYATYYNVRPSIWPVKQKLLFDKVTGRWARSFRFYIQRTYNVSRRAFDPSAHWLLMLHSSRMPAFVTNSRFWEASPVQFLLRDQSKYPISEQIAAVSNSAGLFSVEGAAFAHQVFLAPTAYLLIMQYPRGKCEPQLWHSSLSQYLQLAAVEWRVCPEGIPGGKKGELPPTREEIIIVINFLIGASRHARKKNNGWVCILNQPPPANSFSEEHCAETQERTNKDCWDFGPPAIH